MEIQTVLNLVFNQYNEPYLAHTTTSKNRIQAEVLSAIKGIKRCGVGITMGGGKTLIGLQHMAGLYQPGDRFLVVAPKHSIFVTWEKSAWKFGLEYLLPAITYTTYLSLHKQPFDYTAIYLDECHSLLYTHESWLMQYDGLILGLTGTPPRFAHTEKGQMVTKFCPIVFTYLIDEAVEDGLLNDYRILIHHLPLCKKKTVKVVSKKTGQEWYTSEAETYRYWNDKIEKFPGDAGSREGEWLRLQRMRVLMSFSSKVSYTRRLVEQTGNKTIVFANTQKQAEEICPHSYHSNNKQSHKNLELFLNGTIKCLSSVTQLNEGVNIPGLKEGIILHSYSNERKTAQRIGRLLRLNPGDVALAHILCYNGTVDEQWVRTALQDFDKEKIFHYYPWKGLVYDFYGRSVKSIQLPWGSYYSSRL